MATTIATLLIDVKANTSGLSRSFKTLGGIIAGLGFGVAAAGAKALDAAADFESLATGFRVLVGDVDKANTALAELQKFAAVTPFETEEILKSAKALVGFGIGVEDATQNIKDLAAAAAAGGGDLQKIAVNFAQISAAGKATARDLREFVNQGIPVFDLLADSLGKSVLEIQEMQSQGRITGDILADAFAKAAGPAGKFGQALIEQSKTFNGLVSTIKSQFQIVMINLGQKILPAAKIAAEGLVNAFNDLIDSVNDFDIGGKAVIKITAGIKSAFESASTEVQLFVLNAKKTFLGFAEFFQRQATALANTKLGDVLFSDEDIQNSNKNLVELRNELFNLDIQIKGLELSGKTFKDRYDENIKLVEERFKQLGDTVTETVDKIDEKVEPIVRAAGFENFGTLPTRGGVTGAPARDETIRASNTELTAQQQHLVDLQAAWENLGAIGQNVTTNFIAGFEQLGATFGEVIGGLVTGTLSWADAWGTIKGAITGFIKSILSELLKLLARTLAIALLLQALGLGAASLGKTIKGILSGGIKVPFLADGGLVTSPTVALIGEAGPEVVIPLDKLAKFGGVQQVQVTGRIDGNDIALLMERAGENRLRRTGF